MAKIEATTQETLEAEARTARAMAEIAGVLERNELAGVYAVSNRIGTASDIALPDWFRCRVHDDGGIHMLLDGSQDARDTFGALRALAAIAERVASGLLALSNEYAQAFIKQRDEGSGASVVVIDK